MPSPFPGMDPYLEHPDLWPGVHGSLIVYSRDDLQPQLLPRYIASIEERVYVEPLGRPIRPDVRVLEEKPPPPGGGVAVAVRPQVAVAEPEWLAVLEEVREPYLVILDALGREVVTVIEFLSPSNKRPGVGRETYLRKQREVLQSEANLVEVDLLRGGMHTVAVPEEVVGEADYVVSLRRVDRPLELGVVRFRVREELKGLAIPLRPGEEDVVLDLAGVVRRVYEAGAYHLRIDYTRPPEPPLRPEDARWAEEQIQKWQEERQKT